MKSARIVRRRGDFPLSGESLTGILRAVLAKGKPLRFRARGLSMSPFIKDGDVVTVAPLKGSPPRTGDVVAFLHPATGKAALHRVVRAGSGSYFLKGDNSAETDGALPRERILGLVTRVEREGKRVRLGSRGGAVIAKLSRSGALARAVDAARRAGLRKKRSS
jgi:phage repressor protein C with HTH and peptisase S24 domain